VADNPSETAFERSDVPPRLLIALATGLAATVAAVLIALAIVFPEALVPNPRGPSQPLPPKPRLQTVPADDLVRLRQAELRRLGGYGVTVDGHVRIPIEQAMRKVASQGWSATK
jgi:hypothetical protein